jgi:hypothetical protein
MAGFEVITYGRFWVTTKVQEVAVTAKEPRRFRRTLGFREGTRGRPLR